jgi:hypothetical protein
MEGSGAVATVAASEQMQPRHYERGTKNTKKRFDQKVFFVFSSLS